MNLIQFQRTPLNAWSGVGRLPDLCDEVERLFHSPSRTANASTPWVPALDVYEQKDNYLVQVELPGVNKDDVKLSLEQGTLTITGERKGDVKEETAEAYHVERFQGRFQRTVNLPESIASDKVTAQYKDGVLTVTLPKREEAKPRQIDIVLN
jgi:HSP20 family protein